MVPPPPIRMPASAPFAPPRIAPMTAPTPAPAPIFPASPLMPSLSSASVTVARIGIRTRADRETIESDSQAAGPLDPSRLLDRADHAAHDRSGGHDHAVALPQVDQRRRFEAIFDLRGRRAERALQPHVELGADRHVARAVARPVSVELPADRRAPPGSLEKRRRDIAARAAANAVDPIAQVQVLVRDRSARSSGA